MSKQKPTWDDEPEAQPKEEVASPQPRQLVRVRCIADTRPFTGTRALALQNGEEADIPDDVAKVLVERGDVEYVK